jgi:undecaprenyl-diphosphatase
MIDFIRTIDSVIIQYINTNLSGSSISAFFNLFTFLGYYGAVWILLLVILSLSRRNRFLWRLWGLSYLLILFVCELGLKNLVQRPRPFVDFPDLVISTVKPMSYSFPSSHAVMSGAALVIFIYTLKKRAFLPYIAVLAALISVSRVFLKVHYPSDVLLGFVIGMIIPVIIAKVFPADYTSSNVTTLFPAKKNRML